MSIAENNNEGFFSYKIKPVSYNGQLNENVQMKNLSIKSSNRLNRKKLFERASKFIKEKYNVSLKSLDVTCDLVLNEDYNNVLFEIIRNSFPVVDVYNGEFHDGEEINALDSKKIIDAIVSDDIGNLVGSESGVDNTIKKSLKELEAKNAKIYRVYKDGKSMGIFLTKACKLDQERSKKILRYDNAYAALRDIDRDTSVGFTLKTISNEKNFCLLLLAD